jgi:hypothetical protein
MRNKLRRVVLVVLLLAAALGGGAFWAYRATQHVPAFYQQAMLVSAERYAAASDELLHQTTVLYDNLRHREHWDATFTAEQINGWLAVDLVQNHPQALPDYLRDPRIRISPTGIELACRYDREITTVFSLDVEAYLPEPNVLALRVRGARAGSLPLPLGTVLDAMAQGAQRLKLRIRWAQSDGDPVALVQLPAKNASGAWHYQIEAIELRDGAIYLAGRTYRGADASHAIARRQASDDEKDTRQ